MVKIVMISDCNGNVSGLGSDNKVYQWDTEEGCWVLYVTKED